MKKNNTKKTAGLLLALTLAFAFTFASFIPSVIPVSIETYAENVADENETSKEAQDAKEVITEGAAADVSAVSDDETAEEAKMSFTERIAEKFATSLGKYVPREVVVVFISMLPILELRAGLFVAKFLDLNIGVAIPLCIVGNIIPIPFILLFIKKIFKWMGKTKLFHKLIEKLESRAMKKSSALANGEFIGLMLFVGIPIPGTGAWMGSLIAALLDVDFKKAIIAELVGIAMATVIVSLLSYGLLGRFI